MDKKKTKKFVKEYIKKSWIYYHSEKFEKMYGKKCEIIFFYTFIFPRVSLRHKGSVQRVDAKNVIGAAGRETAVSDMVLFMASNSAIEAVSGSVTAWMKTAEVEANFLALNTSAVRHAPPVSAMHNVTAMVRFEAASEESGSCEELLGGHGQQGSAAAPKKR